MLNINVLNQRFSKNFNDVFEQQFAIAPKNRCFFIAEGQSNIIHFFYQKDFAEFEAVEERLIICNQINEKYIAGFDLIKEDFRIFKISNVVGIENHLKHLNNIEDKEEYFSELKQYIFFNPNVSYFLDLNDLNKEEDDYIEFLFPKEAIKNFKHFLHLENTNFQTIPTDSVNFVIKIEEEKSEKNVETNNPSIILLDNEKAKEIASQLIKEHNINNYVIVEDNLQGMHKNFLTLKELIDLIIQKYSNVN